MTLFKSYTIKKCICTFKIFSCLVSKSSDIWFDFSKFMSIKKLNSAMPSWNSKRGLSLSWLPLKQLPTYLWLKIFMTLSVNFIATMACHDIYLVQRACKIRAVLHILDWLIFHYFLQLIFRLTPLISTAKSNEKIVNQKLCNTVLILDAL